MRLRLLMVLALCACADTTTEIEPAHDAGVARDADSKGPKTQPKDATAVPVPKSDAPPARASTLPCEVEALLETQCQSCHGVARKYGAPMSLVTLDDLHAMSSLEPDKHIYEQLAMRVHAETSPMPPPPSDRLSEDQLAMIDAWVAAGAPAGDGKQCARVDAGAVEPPMNELEGPPDCEDYFELRAHAEGKKSGEAPFQVPSGQAGDIDRYTCFYFTPQYDEEAQGLWFASQLDNTAIIHHWILYGTDTATHPDGSIAPCAASEPGAYMISGWAPGFGEFALPDGVGLRLPPKGGQMFLELHHYNDTGKPQTDSTGVRFCTAKKGTREHLAAVHFTGTEAICLPPGKDSEAAGVCNPRQDQGDIHVIGVWPHMHKHGRRMKLTITRKGGAQELLHDQPFAFQNQRRYVPDAGEVIIKPGDSIETRCFYRNDGTTAIPFGENTDQEMCFGFVVAWPAGALSVNPIGLNPAQVIGVGIAPALRCLDPAALFGSCDGLFNYPVPRLF